jgi:hypothetical protein
MILFVPFINSAYDYNMEKEIQTVRYQTGKVYNHLRVPEKVYKEMRAIMVKGIYINRNIKGEYAYEEVTPQFSSAFKH